MFFPKICVPMNLCKIFILEASFGGQTLKKCFIYTNKSKSSFNITRMVSTNLFMVGSIFAGLKIVLNYVIYFIFFENVPEHAFH